jgi:hypothetical protein
MTHNTMTHPVVEYSHGDVPVVCVLETVYDSAGSIMVYSVYRAVLLSAQAILPVLVPARAYDSFLTSSYSTF